MKMIKEYLRKTKLKKEKEIERRNVADELPDFTNRLVLLLNAGLVLTSAAAKITEEEERDCYFYKELRNINERVRNVIARLLQNFVNSPNGAECESFCVFQILWQII